MRWVWILVVLFITGILGLTLFFFFSNSDSANIQFSDHFPEISLVQVADGLFRPVHATHAGDGSGRIFIVEQRGQIFILQEDLLEEPFLNIDDRVESPSSGGGSEEGLLSIAFPPDYAEKGYFYVYYTMRDGDNVLSRFHLSADPDRADPASEEQILVFPHPIHRNHNGGQLVFGPDGYLYIGTGDGGGGGDPFENAQDPASLLGKLLRIDVEKNSSTQPPINFHYHLHLPIVNHSSLVDNNSQLYAIPQDNPFIDDPDFRPEIWALGLRNPWRFSFDRETGDLYIADVGQDRWEEVNFQPSDSPGGENYGWNIMEGFECFQANECDTEGLTLPIHVYRTRTDGCSITGGYVYRGPGFPDLDGIYLFGDWCQGLVWGLQQIDDSWEHNLLIDTNFMISSFGEDEIGEIYVIDHSGGGIYQVITP